jgi:outer membrane lipoprotein SlyB
MMATRTMTPPHVAHCSRAVRLSVVACMTGTLTASTVTTAMRMENATPLARPATVTAVRSVKISGEPQPPVMTMAATWSASSPTTRSSEGRSSATRTGLKVRNMA